jgi:ParB-like chromosome segregation protein Spo0J
MESQATIPPTLEQLSVPLSGLKPYPGNPRRGRVDVVRSSLERHGQYRPIVVNRRTMEVLAGNHTMRAALELGWSEIAATFVDVDEDQAARIVLVDNRASDMALNDDDELVALLESLAGSEGGLDGTGYNTDELDALLDGIAGRDRDDAEPEPDTSPQLGALEYRLVVECDDEQQQAEWLEKLQDAGLKVQAIAA